MCGGVFMRCALGTYRKTRGGGEMGMKSNEADTEFTSCVLQKTEYFMHWWQHQVLGEKRCLSIMCFRLVLLALTHCIVNEAFKKEVI